jgi:hypothetical protein
MKDLLECDGSDVQVWAGRPQSVVDVDCCSAGPKNFSSFVNPQILHRVHKNSSLSPLLRQRKPSHILIHSTIYAQISQIIVSHEVPDKNVICLSNVSFPASLPHVSSPWLYHYDDISCRVRVLIIKANEMHCFSNLFDKVLYMFRTGPLSIIRSISTLHAIHASSVGCLLADSQQN